MNMTGVIGVHAATDTDTVMHACQLSYTAPRSTSGSPAQAGLP